MELYVSKKEQGNITQMQLEIMKKELDELNSKYPLEDEKFDIKTIYSIKSEDGAETYIYIRNNTSKKVSLENFPICLKKDKRIVAETKPNFKELGYIPEHSAAPFKVEFKMDEIYYPKYIAKAQASIEGKLLVENTVNSKIENMPENLDYYQKEFLNEYFSSLPNLRKDTYDINVVSLSEGDDRSLNITMLVRNGYSDLEIVVEKLPIKVYNQSGILIYSGAFETNDFKIKREMSRFFNIVLPKEYLLVKEDDNYNEFKVEFK